MVNFERIIVPFSFGMRGLSKGALHCQVSLASTITFVCTENYMYMYMYVLLYELLARNSSGMECHITTILSPALRVLPL